MTFNQSDHRFDLLSHLSGHLVVAVLNLRLSFCVRVLNMAVYALVVLLMMIKKVTWDCKLFQRAPSLLPIGEFRYRRNGWPLAVWRQPMVNVLSAHPCWQCQLMTSLTGWGSSFWKLERRTAPSTHQNVCTDLHAASSVFWTNERFNLTFGVNLLSRSDARFGGFWQTLEFCKCALNN